jgi:hypothetical protein
VLAVLRPELTQLGFAVELGKSAGEKIKRPVFFGENGTHCLGTVGSGCLIVSWFLATEASYASPRSSERTTECPVSAQGPMAAIGGLC